MRVSPLFNEEAAQWDANLIVELTHEDLTETATTTAEVIEAFTVHTPYQSIEGVRMELIEPFEDASDTTNDSTLVEVGDDGDTDRLVTSTEVNANTTHVHQKAGTGTKWVPTTDNTVDIKVTPHSGTALSDIDTGKLRVLIKLQDSRE